MQTYEIMVKNRSVKANSPDMTLVRTSVGIDRVHILFDDAEWLDFPIKITFAQGEELVSQPLTVSLIDDASDWVAEATVTVPHEVIDMVGPIRVTLQGTDSNGRHIITAKGSPLSVEEAGDVVEGSMPEDAPTQGEWEQAYADAMTLLNEVQTIKDNLQSRLDAMVASVEQEVSDGAQAAVDQILGTYAVPATRESLGLVQIGDGLSISTQGILSASTSTFTASDRSQLSNLAALAYYCFDTEFDEDTGALLDTAKAKPSAIPLAEMVDGDTIAVVDGKLSLAIPIADGEGF